MRARLLPVLIGLSGALAVAAGAFAAHGVAGKPAEWLHTGALYQLIHAVAALAVFRQPGGRKTAWLFIIGAGLFAGTLYAMALDGSRWLGAITPLGGLGLIAGWLLLGFGAARR